MGEHTVKIDAAKCIGCGQCARTCVTHRIALRDKKAGLVSESCILCGQCVAVCPSGAVSISGCETDAVEKTGETRLDPAVVLDVIRFRRSVRQFQSKPIPRDVILQILEAGRLTHTAKNMQDVSFVVLEGEKDRMEHMAVRLFRKIKPLAGLFSPLARSHAIPDDFFFFGAPAAVVILSKNRTNGILAAQNMEFVAEANGLGVLFSGYFTTAVNTSSKLRRAIQVPKGKHAAATLVLGYPDISYRRSAPRKKLDAQFR